MALGMVMALALLVYALGEWALRRGLAETGSSLPDQKGKPTQRPTLRWVFGLFLWVRLAELGGRPPVLNPAPGGRGPLNKRGLEERGADAPGREGSGQGPSPQIRWRPKGNTPAPAQPPFARTGPRIGRAWPKGWAARWGMLTCL